MGKGILWWRNAFGVVDQPRNIVQIEVGPFAESLFYILFPLVHRKLCSLSWNRLPYLIFQRGQYIP